MNELRSEDVMKALEICTDPDRDCDCHFKCPFGYIGSCEATLKNYSLALLREKNAGISMMAECIKRQDKEISQKDAEIEKEKALKNIAYDNNHNCYRLGYEDAITEFEGRLGKWFSHDPVFLGVEKRLIIDVVDQIAKEMKEKNDEKKS